MTSQVIHLRALQRPSTWPENSRASSGHVRAERPYQFFWPEHDPSHSGHVRAMVNVKLIQHVQSNKIVQNKICLFCLYRSKKLYELPVDTLQFKTRTSLLANISTLSIFITMFSYQIRHLIFIWIYNIHIFNIITVGRGNFGTKETSDWNL